MFWIPCFGNALGIYTFKIRILPLNLVPVELLSPVIKH